MYTGYIVTIIMSINCKVHENPLLDRIPVTSRTGSKVYRMSDEKFSSQ